MKFRSQLATVPSVNGPDSTRAADKIRRLVDSKAQWPYQWIYPPPNAKNRQPWGSVACPAGNTPTQIMSFTVPTGMRFYLTGMIRQFVGAGFIEGAGNALWTLALNSPVGANPVQALSIADFVNQPYTRGNFDQGPTHFEMPEVFEAQDVISDIVVTDGSITPGAPNYFVTVLFGWTVPAE
jgi:hypothetical protein